jgi:hypothetical protein
VLSKPGLILQVANPQAAHGFDDEIVEFVGVGAAAVPPDALASIDDTPSRTLGHKGRITRRLDAPVDLVERLVTRDVFPMIGSRASNLRLQQAAIAHDFMLEGRAFLIERAPT